MCGKRIGPVRVLIADQRRIVRAGIKVLLMEMRSWQPFEPVEAESAEETFAMLTRGRFDVILLDCEIPGRGGIKATEIITKRWPGTCILGLSDKDECLLAERMVAAGASGMILRNVEVETLTVAIKTVMGGKKFYSNEIAVRMLESKSVANRNALDRLTERERQVLLSILEGFCGSEISARLGIAKRTVDKHRQHINYKLGTRTALELVQAGLRLGLLSGRGIVG